MYWTSSKSYLCSHPSGNWIWQRNNPSFMFMLCSYWMDLPRNMKKIWYPQPRFTRRQIHIVLDYIIHVNPPFPCCLHLQPAEGLFVMPHPTAQQAAHPADAANGGPLLRRSGVAPGAGQKKTDAQPLDKGKIGRKNPYLPEKNVVSYGHVLETIQPMKELRKNGCEWFRCFFGNGHKILSILLAWTNHGI